METEAEIPEPIPPNKIGAKDEEPTCGESESFEAQPKVESGLGLPAKIDENLTRTEHLEADTNVNSDAASRIIKGDVGTCEGEGFLASPSLAKVGTESTCTASGSSVVDEKMILQQGTLDNETQLQKDLSQEAIEETYGFTGAENFSVPVKQGSADTGLENDGELAKASELPSEEKNVEEEYVEGRLHEKSPKLVFIDQNLNLVPSSKNIDEDIHKRENRFHDIDTSTVEETSLQKGEMEEPPPRIDEGNETQKKAEILGQEVEAMDKQPPNKELSHNVEEVKTLNHSEEEEIEGKKSSEEPELELGGYVHETSRATADQNQESLPFMPDLIGEYLKRDVTDTIDASIDDEPTKQHAEESGFEEITLKGQDKSSITRVIEAGPTIVNPSEKTGEKKQEGEENTENNNIDSVSKAEESSKIQNAMFQIPLTQFITEYTSLDKFEQEGGNMEQSSEETVDSEETSDNENPGENENTDDDDDVEIPPVTEETRSDIPEQEAGKLEETFRSELEEKRKEKIDSNEKMKDEKPVGYELSDTEEMESPLVTLATEGSHIQEQYEPDTIEETLENKSVNIEKDKCNEAEPQDRILETVESTIREKAKDDENPETKLDASFIKQDEGLQMESEKLVLPLTIASIEENDDKQGSSVIESRGNTEPKDNCRWEIPNDMEASERRMQTDETEEEKLEKSLDVVSEAVEPAASNAGVERSTSEKEELIERKNFNEERKEGNINCDDKAKGHRMQNDENLRVVDQSQKIETMEGESPNMEMGSLIVADSLVEGTKQEECEQQEEESNVEVEEQVHEENRSAPVEDNHIEEELRARENMKSTVLEQETRDGAQTLELISKLSEMEVEGTEKLCKLDSREKSTETDASSKIEEQTEKNEETSEIVTGKTATEGEVEKMVIEEDSCIPDQGNVSFGDQKDAQNSEADENKEALKINGEEQNCKTNDTDKATKNEIINKEVSAEPSMAGVGEDTEKHTIEECKDMAHSTESMKEPLKESSHEGEIMKKHEEEVHKGLDIECEVLENSSTGENKERQKVVENSTFKDPFVPSIQEETVIESCKVDEVSERLEATDVGGETERKISEEYGAVIDTSRLSVVEATVKGSSEEDEKEAEKLKEEFKDYEVRTSKNMEDTKMTADATGVTEALREEMLQKEHSQTSVVYEEQIEEKDLEEPVNNNKSFEAASARTLQEVAEEEEQVVTGSNVASDETSTITTETFCKSLPLVDLEVKLEEVPNPNDNETLKKTEVLGQEVEIMDNKASNEKPSHDVEEVKVLDHSQEDEIEGKKSREEPKLDLGEHIHETFRGTTDQNQKALPSMPDSIGESLKIDVMDIIEARIKDASTDNAPTKQDVEESDFEGETLKGQETSLITRGMETGPTIVNPSEKTGKKKQEVEENPEDKNTDSIPKAEESSKIQNGKELINHEGTNETFHIPPTKFTTKDTNLEESEQERGNIEQLSQETVDSNEMLNGENENPNVNEEIPLVTEESISDKFEQGIGKPEETSNSELEEKSQETTDLNEKMKDEKPFEYELSDTEDLESPLVTQEKEDSHFQQDKPDKIEETSEKESVNIEKDKFNEADPEDNIPVTAESSTSEKAKDDENVETKLDPSSIMDEEGLQRESEEQVFPLTNASIEENDDKKGSSVTETTDNIEVAEIIEAEENCRWEIPKVMEVSVRSLQTDDTEEEKLENSLDMVSEVVEPAASNAEAERSTIEKEEETIKRDGNLGVVDQSQGIETMQVVSPKMEMDSSLVAYSLVGGNIQEPSKQQLEVSNLEVKEQVQQENRNAPVDDNHTEEEFRVRENMEGTFLEQETIDGAQTLELISQVSEMKVEETVMVCQLDSREKSTDTDASQKIEKQTAENVETSEIVMRKTVTEGEVGKKIIEEDSRISDQGIVFFGTQKVDKNSGTGEKKEAPQFNGEEQNSKTNDDTDKATKNEIMDKEVLAGPKIAGVGEDTEKPIIEESIDMANSNESMKEPPKDCSQEGEIMKQHEEQVHKGPATECEVLEKSSTGENTERQKVMENSTEAHSAPLIIEETAIESCQKDEMSERFQATDAGRETKRTISEEYSAATDTCMLSVAVIGEIVKESSEQDEKEAEKLKEKFTDSDVGISKNNKDANPSTDASGVKEALREEMLPKEKSQKFVVSEEQIKEKDLEERENNNERTEAESARTLQEVAQKGEQLVDGSNLASEEKSLMTTETSWINLQHVDVKGMKLEETPNPSDKDTRKKTEILGEDVETKDKKASNKQIYHDVEDMAGLNHSQEDEIELSDTEDLESPLVTPATKDSIFQKDEPEKIEETSEKELENIKQDKFNEAELEDKILETSESSISEKAKDDKNLETKLDAYSIQDKKILQKKSEELVFPLTNASIEEKDNKKGSSVTETRDNTEVTEIIEADKNCRREIPENVEASVYSLQTDDTAEEKLEKSLKMVSTVVEPAASNAEAEKSTSETEEESIKRENLYEESNEGNINWDDEARGHTMPKDENLEAVDQSQEIEIMEVVSQNMEMDSLLFADSFIERTIQDACEKPEEVSNLEVDEQVHKENKNALVDHNHIEEEFRARENMESTILEQETRDGAQTLGLISEVSEMEVEETVKVCKLDSREKSTETDASQKIKEQTTENEANSEIVMHETVKEGEVEKMIIEEDSSIPDQGTVISEVEEKMEDPQFNGEKQSCKTKDTDKATKNEIINKEVSAEPKISGVGEDTDKHIVEEGIDMAHSTESMQEPLKESSQEGEIMKDHEEEVPKAPDTDFEVLEKSSTTEITERQKESENSIVKDHPAPSIQEETLIESFQEDEDFARLEVTGLSRETERSISEEYGAVTETCLISVVGATLKESSEEDEKVAEEPKEELTNSEVGISKNMEDTNRNAETSGVTDASSEQMLQQEQSQKFVVFEEQIEEKDLEETENNNEMNEAASARTLHEVTQEGEQLLDGSNLSSEEKSPITTETSWTRLQHVDVTGMKLKETPTNPGDNGTQKKTEILGKVVKTMDKQASNQELSHDAEEVKALNHSQEDEIEGKKSSKEPEFTLDSIGEILKTGVIEISEACISDASTDDAPTEQDVEESDFEGVTLKGHEKSSITGGMETVPARINSSEKKQEGEENPEDVNTDSVSKSEENSKIQNGEEITTKGEGTKETFHIPLTNVIAEATSLDKSVQESGTFELSSHGTFDSTETLNSERQGRHENPDDNVEIPLVTEETKSNKFEQEGWKLEETPSMALEEKSQKTIDSSEKIKDEKPVEYESSDTEDLESPLVIAAKEYSDFQQDEPDKIEETSETESVNIEKDKCDKAGLEDKMLQTTESSISKKAKDDGYLEIKLDASSVKDEEGIQRESEELVLPLTNASIEENNDKNGSSIRGKRDNTEVTDIIKAEENHRSEIPKDIEASIQSLQTNETEGEILNRSLDMVPEVVEPAASNAKDERSTSKKEKESKTRENFKEESKEENINWDNEASGHKMPKDENLRAVDRSLEIETMEVVSPNMEMDSLFVAHSMVEGTKQEACEQHVEVSNLEVEEQVHEKNRNVSVDDNNIEEEFKVRENMESTILKQETRDGAQALEFISQVSEMEVEETVKVCKLDSREKSTDTDANQKIEEQTEKHEETSEIVMVKTETEGEAEKMIIEEDSCIPDQGIVLSEVEEKKEDPEFSGEEQSCKTKDTDKATKNEIINKEASAEPNISGVGEDTEKHIMEESIDVAHTTESMKEPLKEISQERGIVKNHEEEVSDRIKATGVCGKTERSISEEYGAITETSLLSVVGATVTESSEEDEKVAQELKEEVKFTVSEVGTSKNMEDTNRSAEASGFTEASMEEMLQEVRSQRLAVFEEQIKEMDLEETENNNEMNEAASARTLHEVTQEGEQQVDGSNLSSEEKSSITTETIWTRLQHVDVTGVKLEKTPKPGDNGTQKKTKILGEAVETMDKQASNKELSHDAEEVKALNRSQEDEIEGKKSCEEPESALREHDHETSRGTIEQNQEALPFTPDSIGENLKIGIKEIIEACINDASTDDAPTGQDVDKSDFERVTLKGHEKSSITGDMETGPTIINPSEKNQPEENSKIQNCEEVTTKSEGTSLDKSVQESGTFELSSHSTFDSTEMLISEQQGRHENPDDDVEMPLVTEETKSDKFEQEVWKLEETPSIELEEKNQETIDSSKKMKDEKPVEYEFSDTEDLENPLATPATEDTDFQQDELEKTEESSETESVNIEKDKCDEAEPVDKIIETAESCISKKSKDDENLETKLDASSIKDEVTERLEATGVSGETERSISEEYDAVTETCLFSVVGATVKDNSEEDEMVAVELKEKCTDSEVGNPKNMEDTKTNAEASGITEASREEMLQEEQSQKFAVFEEKIKEMDLEETKNNNERIEAASARTLHEVTQEGEQLLDGSHLSSEEKSPITTEPSGTRLQHVDVTGAKLEETHNPGENGTQKKTEILGEVVETMEKQASKQELSYDAEEVKTLNRSQEDEIEGKKSSEEPELAPREHDHETSRGTTDQNQEALPFTTDSIEENLKIGVTEIIEACINDASTDDAPTEQDVEESDFEGVTLKGHEKSSITGGMGTGPAITNPSEKKQEGEENPEDDNTNSVSKAEEHPKNQNCEEITTNSAGATETIHIPLAKFITEDTSSDKSVQESGNYEQSSHETFDSNETLNSENQGRHKNPDDVVEIPLAIEETRSEKSEQEVWKLEEAPSIELEEKSQETTDSIEKMKDEKPVEYEFLDTEDFEIPLVTPATEETDFRQDEFEKIEEISETESVNIEKDKCTEAEPEDNILETAESSINKKSKDDENHDTELDASSIKDEVSERLEATGVGRETERSISEEYSAITKTCSLSVAGATVKESSEEDKVAEELKKEFIDSEVGTSKNMEDTNTDAEASGVTEASREEMLQEQQSQKFAVLEEQIKEMDLEETENNNERIEAASARTLHEVTQEGEQLVDVSNLSSEEKSPVTTETIWTRLQHVDVTGVKLEETPNPGENGTQKKTEILGEVVETMDKQTSNKELSHDAEEVKALNCSQKDEKEGKKSSEEPILALREHDHETSRGTTGQNQETLPFTPDTIGETLKISVTEIMEACINDASTDDAPSEQHVEESDLEGVTLEGHEKSSITGGMETGSAIINPNEKNQEGEENPEDNNIGCVSKAGENSTIQDGEEITTNSQGTNETFHIPLTTFITEEISLDKSVQESENFELSSQETVDSNETSNGENQSENEIPDDDVEIPLVTEETRSEKSEPEVWILEDTSSSELEERSQETIDSTEKMKDEKPVEYEFLDTEDLESPLVTPATEASHFQQEDEPDQESVATEKEKCNEAEPEDKILSTAESSKSEKAKDDQNLDTKLDASIKNEEGLQRDSEEQVFPLTNASIEENDDEEGSSVTETRDSIAITELIETEGNCGWEIPKDMEASEHSLQADETEEEKLSKSLDVVTEAAEPASSNAEAGRSNSKKGEEAIKGENYNKERNEGNINWDEKAGHRTPNDKNLRAVDQSQEIETREVERPNMEMDSLLVAHSLVEETIQEAREQQGEVSNLEVEELVHEENRNAPVKDNHIEEEFKARENMESRVLEQETSDVAQTLELNSQVSEMEVEETVKDCKLCSREKSTETDASQKKEEQTEKNEETSEIVMGKTVTEGEVEKMIVEEDSCIPDQGTVFSEEEEKKEAHEFNGEEQNCKTNDTDEATKNEIINKEVSAEPKISGVHQDTEKHIMQESIDVAHSTDSMMESLKESSQEGFDPTENRALQESIEDVDPIQKLEGAYETVAEDQSHETPPQAKENNIKEDNRTVEDHHTASVEDQMAIQTLQVEEMGSMKLEDIGHKTEAELQAGKEDIPNEVTMVAILNEVVRNERDKAETSQHINKWSIEEASTAKGLHTVPIEDATIDELQDSALLSIEKCTEEIDNDVKKDQLDLKTAEFPNKRPEPSPVTEASEGCTTQAQTSEDFVNIFKSVPEVSEEMIEEDITKEAENSKEQLSITSLTEITERVTSQPQESELEGAKIVRESEISSEEKCQGTVETGSMDEVLKRVKLDQNFDSLMQPPSEGENPYKESKNLEKISASEAEEEMKRFSDEVAESDYQAETTSNRPPLVEELEENLEEPPVSGSKQELGGTTTNKKIRDEMPEEDEHLGEKNSIGQFTPEETEDVSLEREHMELQQASKMFQGIKKGSATEKEEEGAKQDEGLKLDPETLASAAKDDSFVEGEKNTDLNEASDFVKTETSKEEEDENLAPQKEGSEVRKLEILFNEVSGEHNANRQKVNTERDLLKKDDHVKTPEEILEDKANALDTKEEAEISPFISEEHKTESPSSINKIATTKIKDEADEDLDASPADEVQEEEAINQPREGTQLAPDKLTHTINETSEENREGDVMEDWHPTDEVPTNDSKAPSLIEASQEQAPEKGSQMTEDDERHILDFAKQATIEVNLPKGAVDGDPAEDEAAVKEISNKEHEKMYDYRCVHETNANEGGETPMPQQENMVVFSSVEQATVQRNFRDNPNEHDTTSNVVMENQNHHPPCFGEETMKNVHQEDEMWGMKDEEIATKLEVEDNSQALGAIEDQEEKINAANGTPNCEILNENVSEGLEKAGAVASIGEQIMEETRMVKEPSLVSLGEETYKESQHRVENEGNKINDTKINLDLEDQSKGLNDEEGLKDKANEVQTIPITQVPHGLEDAGSSKRMERHIKEEEPMKDLHLGPIKEDTIKVDTEEGKKNGQQVEKEVTKLDPRDENRETSCKDDATENNTMNEEVKFSDVVLVEQKLEITPSTNEADAMTIRDEADKDLDTLPAPNTPAEAVNKPKELSQLVPKEPIHGINETDEDNKGSAKDKNVMEELHKVQNPNDTPSNLVANPGDIVEDLHSYQEVLSSYAASSPTEASYEHVPEEIGQMIKDKEWHGLVIVKQANPEVNLPIEETEGEPIKDEVQAEEDILYKEGEKTNDYNNVQQTTSGNEGGEPVQEQEDMIVFSFVEQASREQRIQERPKDHDTTSNSVVEEQSLLKEYVGEKTVNEAHQHEMEANKVDEIATELEAKHKCKVSGGIEDQMGKTTDINDSSKCEILNEEVPEGLEKAVTTENIENQKTKENRTVKDPCLISTEGETCKDKRHEDKKEGEMVNDEEIKLGLEDQSQEELAAEDLGDEANETNKTTNCQTSHDEVSLATENGGSSEKINNQITDEEAIKESFLGTIGEETTEKAHQEEKKAGPEVEKEATNLDPKDQKHETSSQNGAAEKYIHNEEVKSSHTVPVDDLETTASTDKRVDIATIKEDTDVLSTTNPPAEEAPQREAVNEPQEVHHHEPELIPESIITNDETTESTRDDKIVAEEFIEVEKLKTTSSDLVSNPSNIGENLHPKDQEVPTNKSNASSLTEVSKEKIPEKDSHMTEEERNSSVFINQKTGETSLATGEMEGYPINNEAPEQEFLKKEAEKMKDSDANITNGGGETPIPEQQQCTILSSIEQAIADTSIRDSPEVPDTTGNLVFDKQCQVKTILMHEVQIHENEETEGMDLEDTDSLNEKLSLLSDTQPSDKELPQKADSVMLPEVTEISQNIEKLKKAPDATTEESAQKKISSGEKDIPSVQQHSIGESTWEDEIEDQKHGEALGTESIEKGVEYGGVMKDVPEESMLLDIDEVSLRDFLISMKETSHMVAEDSEPTPPPNNGEPQCKEQQTIQGEKETIMEEEMHEGHEEEENDHKKMHSGSNLPDILKAPRNADVKSTHKKSHNILSGVGSKVKHSIAKIKKAIACNVPPPEVTIIERRK